MTAPVLADALGPRARRRVRIASAFAFVLIAGFLYVAIGRFADRGQLEWSRWELLTEWNVMKFLLLGLVNTLKVAAVSMVLALALGATLAMLRLTTQLPLRWLGGSYVQFFRAIPLLLVIYFSGRGLPKLGFDLGAFWYLVLALVVYNGAVLAEIIRAGILSLDRGQTDAAYALGLGYWETMRYVLLPQALRRMLPALVSQLVVLLKDTSLGFVLPYDELLRRGEQTGTFSQNILQAAIVVAAIYIIVNYSLTRFANWLEARQRRRYQAGAIDVTGVEDLAALSVTNRQA